MDKEQVIADTRACYAHLFGNNGINPAAACLLWAASLMTVLVGKYDKRAVLQAGSASWRFVTEEDDDGVSPIFFAYQFELPNAIAQIQAGFFPEMHCWVAIPDTGEIIDASACFQEEQMRKMLGKTWSPELKLPDYLWLMNADDKGDNCGYRADKEACKIAHRFLREYSSMHT
jgi:hypothetical protein